MSANLAIQEKKTVLIFPQCIISTPLFCCQREDAQGVPDIQPEAACSRVAHTGRHEGHSRGGRLELVQGKAQVRGKRWW